MAPLRWSGFSGWASVATVMGQVAPVMAPQRIAGLEACGSFELVLANRPLLVGHPHRCGPRPHSWLTTRPPGSAHQPHMEMAAFLLFPPSLKLQQEKLTLSTPRPLPPLPQAASRGRLGRMVVSWWAAEHCAQRATGHKHAPAA
jgi:hypothetical protein